MRKLIEQGTEAVAAYMRERAARAPSIAEQIPYLIAAEAIRSMTYGVDSVPSADILTVLDAAELAERAER